MCRRFAACGAAVDAWHEVDCGSFALVDRSIEIDRSRTAGVGRRTERRRQGYVDRARPRGLPRRRERRFPARVVTRPPSDFEDNEFMPQSAFEQAAANGAFAVWWSAHGHMYGIPLAVDFDIEAGRTVVCNVSRTVVGALRARYANVVTVLVTAPQDVLQSRLAARERASDGRVSDRMRRLELSEGNLRPDVIINNVGDPRSGASKLVDTLYASGALA
jgi:ribose 1,5-bisphosphokinase